jgi:hypothetical protein
MENPVSEVFLRKRSTPYDFSVVMRRGPQTLGLYSGTSAMYANSAYWQGVRTAIFLSLDGEVTMSVSKRREAYGTFATRMADGKVISLHIPSGQCIEWTSGSWSGDHVYEKIIATIPGMPGPIQTSN